MRLAVAAPFSLRRHASGQRAHWANERIGPRRTTTKLPHRTFEIYELRDEAILALTPRNEKLGTEATVPETWKFKHLSLYRPGGVTLVQFKQASTLTEESLGGLVEDFEKLSDQLGRDSKVLVDFTGTTLANPALIDALVAFHKRLRTKGSRFALCCLDPAVREAFFAAG
jgi:anti-anti-sigma regulatory factor